MNEELKKYYDYLKTSNADVPDNYESFAETLSDEAQAKTYFDYLKANKFDTPDTYESFAETFNLQKKKDSPLELASTGQTVLQELGQPLNESITPKLPSEPKKDRETTVKGDLLRSLKSASLRALGGITETPMFVTRTIQGLTSKPLLKAMGASDEEADALLEYNNTLNTFGQITQKGETAQKALNKSAMKTEAKMKAIEGNIVSNIKEGDWGQAGELLGRGIAQSLPYLAMTVATAGGGTPAVLTTIGATSAAQQYGELEGVPEPQRKLNAWLYGGFEAAGELVTAGLLRGVGKSFRQGMTKTVNPEMVKGMAKGIAKDFGINILEEGGSEMATQIGQNITDIITGVDPNRNVFDNVLDAGLIGGVSGGGIGMAKAGASALGRAMASPKEIQEVGNKVTEQGVLIDQIESTDSDPVKKALESRLKTLSYEANKIMDKNYELAKQLSPEQQSKVAELYSTWNELQAKIDNGEVIEENQVKAIENTIEGVKSEIESIKEAKIAELGEIKQEGVKFKIGDKTFETQEAVEAWLDENYVRRGLDPVWHQPTEKVIDAWVKKNKEMIDRKAYEQMQEEAKGGTETKPTETVTEPTAVEENVSQIKEELPTKTPQEIAQSNDLSFIGKQEGETEAESLDLYNVKVGENEATFAVPSGSNEATVQAKKQETIDRFQPKTEIGGIEDAKTSGTAKDVLNDYLNNWAETILKNKNNFVEEVKTDYDMVLQKLKNLDIIKTNCIE